MIADAFGGRDTVSFPTLASPIRIAGLEIRNRTVMSAMSSVLGSDEGNVTPEILDYYRVRAEGGTGLIVVEFTCVDRRYGRAEMKQLAIDNDASIAAHRELADIIKRTGARAGIQLHAPGQFADRKTLEGLPSAPSVQASRRDGALLCRAFEDDEIHGMVASFGRAAERAVEAGYEAIEIHGAHGYLPMAFMSPLKNMRDDAWGGDEDRRLRFPTEIIRAIKAALGPDRPLIYRLSSSDFLKGGLGLDDMVRIAPKLVAAGADAIHVSSGTIDGTLDRAVDPMSMPEAWRFAHCRAIKAATGVPVIGVGPVRWPQTAEKGIAEGDLDMVALGRTLLADPEWVNKSLAGDVKAIRPCTNCNWCFERVLQHKNISCAENPRAGNETHSPALVGGAGRLAVVVGGGPGGMAAALDFAEAGFRSELYEIRDELGGGLIASATPPHKDKLFWYLDHLKLRLAGSKVSVRTGVAADAAMIVARNPDVVVLSTGARVLDFPIKGVERPNVVSAYALLMDEVALPPPGERPIVVYGGGETGCETAEYLAARGYRIVLVSRSSAKQLARSAEGMYRKHLSARLTSNPNIAIRDNSTITEVRDDSVVLKEAAGEHEVAASHLVLAQGRQTGTEISAALAAAGIPFELVGDVEKIGRIGDAVHAARAAVLVLAARVGSQAVRRLQ